jgi:hypothetical protein
MFIPRGTALHENLATSYVLVDALVADLCEGGFSGVVEIELRDTDARIIIARGKIAAAIESRHSEADYSNHAMRPYARIAVADLALASRRERGRVSIYSYAASAARVIAERINAEPLYTRLSTEFADLEKMLLKLARERDRQWYIEASTESGVSALVRIKEEGCLILTSQDGGPMSQSETIDLASNEALRSLLDECNRAGGVFDVYFKSATEIESQSSDSAPVAAQSSVVEMDAGTDISQSNVSQSNVSQAVMEAKAVFESLSVETPRAEVAASESNRKDYASPYSAGAASYAETSAERYENGEAKEIAKMSAAAASDLLLVQDDLRATGLLKRGSEPDRMAEVKRLMGEIAKTIEDATLSAELRDSFPMHLRAGQLKIADRYPFLDPFGAEFEYLAGEIVFVGRASAGEFITGLTEALKFAVEAAIKSSAQPGRLRGRIADELDWLLKRQKPELQQHGLDQSVDDIIISISNS